MEVAGDTFALVLPDGDLGEDLLALEQHIAAMVTDNGNKEVQDNDRDDQSEEKRNIQDLTFHCVKSTYIFAGNDGSSLEGEFLWARYNEESNCIDEVCDHIDV